MTNRRAAILLTVGIVLLIAGAVGFWGFARPALFPPPPTARATASPIPTFAPPPFEFTPPPSLNELATQYPELAPILDDPELSSAYKEFLAAYQSGGIEAARDLARKRGVLDDQDRLRATLELDTQDTAPIQAELEPYGVQVLGVYQNLMDIAMPLRIVEALAEASDGNPGAIFQKLTSIKHVVHIRLPNKTQPQDDPVTGEGVRQTGADLWHQTGITGKGIKVGVLDLGFKDYDTLLGQGLPDASRVVAMSFVSGEEPQQSDEVHGTAVAEIVSEMAPDAELFLAYYDGGDVSFANAVNWLLSQGVQIISHSAGGSVGPMDGSESDALIVDQVTAQNILWVNASGNEAGNHYSGVFTDTNGDGWHEFPNGTNFMGIIAGPGGAAAYLNWDDWKQLTQDFDLYMFDGQGTLIGASEEMQNGGAGQWAAAARHWVMLVLGAELFLPHGGAFWVRLATLAAALPLLCAALAVTETWQAKMRILRVPRFLAAGAGIALLGLVSWYLGGGA
ncbi:MAG: S8 family serine peptidase [Chloroflexota bacterium]